MCGLINVVASFLATNLILRSSKNFDKVIGADYFDNLLYSSDAKERNISNLRKFCFFEQNLARDKLPQIFVNINLK